MKYHVYNGENISMNDTLRNLFFIVDGWSLSTKNRKQVIINQIGLYNYNIAYSLYLLFMNKQIIKLPRMLWIPYI